MMGAARSAIDQHQRRARSFFFHIKLSIADIDPLLLQTIDTVAPAKSWRNFSDEFWLDSDDSIKD